MNKKILSNLINKIKQTNKKILYGLIGFCAFTILVFTIILVNGAPKNSTITNTLEGEIVSITDNTITIRDKQSLIYRFDKEDWQNVFVQTGDYIIIEYTGLLDSNKDYQDIEIINYTTPSNDTYKTENLENGIFKEYYVKAQNKLKTLSLEEKIGQLFLVRYPDNNALTDLQKYHFSGFVFFEKDFRNKTPGEVKTMIKTLQNSSTIPLLTAVDEEGGSVVRISSNPALADAPFKSPSQLYEEGGLSLIKEDTINKSKLLKSLGLNVNLAPVVDVTTDPTAYMYERSLKENTSVTSEYAKTVIEASKDSYVSYVLKHFPGYGNNTDTHTGASYDTRTLEELKQNDLPPFEAGIASGAEAILVSHNIVDSLGSSNPASLSPSVHNFLRSDLNFTGIIIADDISMSALDGVDNPAVKAILAGNNLIITTNYQSSINSVKEAINRGILSTDLINNLALNVLAWKYYKGLIIDNQK